MSIRPSYRPEFPNQTRQTRREGKRRPVARPASGVKVSAEPLEARIAPAAVIVATLTDNTGGPVLPGGNIHYTEVILNTAVPGAGNDALNLQIANALDPNLVLVPGSLNVSPLALNDTFDAVGNTQLFVNAAGTVTGTFPAAGTVGNIFANDMEFENDLGVQDTFTLTAVGATAFGGSPVTIATTGGGSVTVSGDGTFVYTPAAGFTGADTFTYTISDDGFGGTNALSGTGTVTLNVANKVWYVDSSYAGANGASNGTSNRPFTSLTPLNAGGDPDGTGDIIYLREAGDNYTAGITLEGSQTLHGSHQALTVGGYSLATASATAPTISLAAGTAITLASGNTLRGFIVGNSQRDILGTNFGTLTVNDVTLNGTGKTLDLETGTFAAGSVFNSIASTGTSGLVADGHGMRLVGIGGSVNFGSTTISGSERQAIFVHSSTANITFGNTAIGTGTAGSGSGGGTEGIRLEANTGGTHTFGTLNVQNTTAQGIQLFGGASALTATGAATISNTAGTGLLVQTHTGAVSFQALSLSGIGGDGIFLNGHNASFTTTGGTIATTTGIDVRITDGTGAVTIAESITNTTGGFIAIDNHETGNITFSGNLSSTSGASGIVVQNVNSGTVAFTAAAKTLTTGANNGITLANNTGATINFSGSTAGLNITTTSGAGVSASNGGTINFLGGNLDIDSTTGAGFTATGGGTVTVTGSGNTIASTTGTALNVANTTIGASGLTFQSISANGAASGIILNTTGGGGLTVTGDGGSANNGSGGTIQNTTGQGISLTSTVNVSLDQMNIQSTGGSGISGVTVTNFTFTNGTVNNSGNAVGESNIAFNGNGTLLGNNIAGTLTITGSTLTNAFDGGIEVQSSDGTITNATITGNTITSSTSTATSKGSGIKFVLVGTATTVANLTRATIGNNIITNFPSDAGIEIKGGNTNASGPGGNYGTPGSGTNVIAITGNSIAGQSAANRMGTDFVDIGLSGGNAASRSVANIAISGNGTVANPLANTAGIGIGFGNTGYATMTLSITNNVMVANNTVASAGIGGGNGVVVSNTETPDLTVTISNNNISQVDGNGILVVGRGVSGTLKAKIDNNTVAAPLTGVRPGIRVDAGNSSSADDAVFLNIFSNTSAGSGGSEGIGVRKQGTNATINDFALFDAAGGPALAAVPTIAQVEAFIEALNPAGGGGFVINGDNFLRDTTQAPALLFEPPAGEVAVEPDVVPSPTETTPVEAPPIAEVPIVEPPIAEAPVLPPAEVLQDGLLSQDELAALVEAAIFTWEATGLSAAQSALLRNIVFEVADFSGRLLGQASPGHIILDSNGASMGWYVDATPLDSSEFGNGNTYVNGHLDAFTTVLHELGHVLGIEDTYDFAQRGDVMYGFLHLGERRLPTAGQAEGAEPDAEAAPDFVFSPIVGGRLSNATGGALVPITLPAGKGLTVNFDATVPTNITASQVSTQGTITWTGGSVVTNDPDTLTANDPTITTIDLPDVSVAVVPASVTEDGAGNLVYTFTRTGPTDFARTINFSIGGGATFGSDYTQTGAATFGETTGTVTFAVGSSTATVTIDPTVDTTVEGDETVLLTVTSGTGYDVGTPAAATGTINNDDTDVSVSVEPGSVTENGATNLVYTFTRTGVTSDAKQVNFTVTGTASLPDGDFGVSASNTFSLGTFTGLGTIVFPAGSSTVTFTVNPNSDNVVESDETAIVTLTSGTGYNVATPSVATGTILNDDTDVTLAIAPSSVTEDGAGNLVYTFTRNGFVANALTVSFNVAGSATFNTDYTQSGAATFNATTGTVTFLAGATTATVTIDPSADTTVEGDETTLLTLATGSGYNVATAGAVTGTITNDDTDVTLAVAPASVTEDGAGNLVYTFTRTGVTSNELVVQFSLAGDAQINTDYALTGQTTVGVESGTITFAPGVTTVTLTVDPTTDTTVEDDETVVIGIIANPGYNAASPSATGTITNDDTDVEVGAEVTTVSEDGSENLVVTFFRSGLLTGSTTVNFTIGGSATFNTDYTQSGAVTFNGTTGTVTFAPGEEVVEITLDPTADSTVEPDETVVITVASGTGYNPLGNPFTGTITNDDSSVTVAVAPSSVVEDGAGNLVYTFTRTGFLANQLTVNVNVAGTASLTGDYGNNFATFNTGTGAATVVFAEGASTATVIIDPTADATGESDETVSLTLAAGSGYVVGTPGAATGTIVDDDTSINVTLAPASVVENSLTGLVYTFNRVGDNSTALTINFSVGGSATFTNDYTQTGAATFTGAIGTVVMAAGATTATVTLIPVNDRLVEGSETAVITVAAGAGYGIGGSPASGTITDNDTATISFGGPTSNVSEGTASHLVGLVLNIIADGTGTVALDRDVTFNVNDVLGGTATPGGTDYSVPGLLTFSAGAASGATQDASISIVNDRIVEGAETATLGLALGTDGTGGQVTIGAGASHTATITDNDTATIAFNAPTSSVDEAGLAGPTFVLTITGDGTGTPSLGSSVNFNVTTTGGTATGGGTDYSLPSTITFASGSLSGATIGSELPIFNDRLVEGSETAILGLAMGGSTAGGQVTIAGGASHTLTITDNDTATIGFVTPASTVGEAAGNDVLALVLNISANGEGPTALARDVTFNVTTVPGGTATGGGTDYTLPATLTFAAGAASGATQNASLGISDDTLVEGDETATLGLAIVTDNTNGQVTIAGEGAGSHTTTITDNDADLSITKTDGATTEIPGTTVTYTITVSNPGLTAVTGASVTDTFANILTGISWSAVGVGGAGGFTVNGNGNINDTAVNLPAGASVTYTVTGTIQSSATGTLVNTATVGVPAGFIDQNPGNNSATDTDTLTPEGDLIITKTDGKVSQVPGTNTTYTIVVSNTGPSDVVGASIVDVFPAGFSNISVTASSTGGATGFTANGSGNINDTVNIPAGGTITYTVTGLVGSSLTGTFANTATVTAPATFVDTTSGNNSATDIDTLTPQVDLVLTKTDSPDPVFAGNNLTYTITLVNNGPSDAQNISITDVLPPGLTFVSLTAAGGFSATTPAVGGTGTVTITAPSMASGASATFTLVVDTASSLEDGALIVNTAAVTTITEDVNVENNSDTESTTVDTRADLSILKTGALTAIVGQNYTYTLTLANLGESDAQAVSVTDVLPAGMTFVSATVPGGWSALTPAVGANGTVTFSNASMAADGQVVFTITVTPLPSIGGTTVTNTGSATTTTADPAAGNNASSIETTIQGTDLTLTKTDSLTTVAPGDTITYVLTYTNNGFVEAQGVVITETLPAGTTFIAAENPGWVDAGGGQYTFNVGSVAVEATGTVNFIVHVNAVVASGQETVGNSATITDNGASGPDINPGDNATADTDTLNAAPELQITIVDDPGTALRGRPVAYTITYTNAGNQDATNLTITQTLPANTSFNFALSSAGWTQTGPNTFEFEFASLAGGGGTGDVVFAVTLDNNLPPGLTQISTTGTIDDGGLNGADPNPANNTDTETTGIYQGIYVVSPGISLPRKAPPATIRVFDIATGTETTITPYDASYRQSVRVATGDINGDGYDDIITSTITGTGNVRVFDGRTGARFEGPFSEIEAFPENGARGAYVASADVNGDGRDDIIVGSGYRAGGTPKVRVFSGGGYEAGQQIFNYQPFASNFKGGVRVASGDVNGDGIADIIASQGVGGNDIKVTSGITTNVLHNIDVGGNKYKGGVFVAAAADLNNDGKADIIAGRDRGETKIEIFSGADKSILSTIVPFAPKYKLGVRVAAADVNLDGVADIIAGSGGNNGSLVKFFDGVTKAEITGKTFAAFPQFPHGALFVAGTSPVPGTLINPPQPA